jgi:hypothetical protein
MRGQCKGVPTTTIVFAARVSRLGGGTYSYADILAEHLLLRDGPADGSTKHRD